MFSGDVPSRGSSWTEGSRAYRDLDKCVRLDAADPVHVGHTGPPGPLTVSVVSVAWLRERSPTALRALASACLTEPETRQLSELRLPKRRLEWLAGRLAIKRAVCAHLERFTGTVVGDQNVRIRTVTTGMCAGKPVVNQPVEIGLSHSGDFAVAVCGPRPVGVDLEQRHGLPPYLARALVRERPHEAAGPDCLPVTSMPLTLRWTCKEAVLKYLGIGLRVDAGEVELTGWDADGRFFWQAGSGLRRLLHPARFRGVHGWARQMDDCALALVWRQ